jgi:flagellin
VVGSGDQDRVSLPVINLRTGAVGDLIRQDASGAFNVDLGSADPSTLNATLKSALAQVSVAQADVGGGQSRLALAADVAATAAANQEAALGAIVDADLAAETTQLARLKILSEGHTAMLAQARDVTAKLLPLLSRN